jgi:aryl-alcohol dehydrogenase-like predicted oxidoreductase
MTTAATSVEPSGIFTLGSDLTVHRLGTWLLRRSPVMLPIPGTSSLAHLEENVAAAALELSDEQASRLQEVR